MKQLSGLDAAFLHLELPEMPMHIGALHLFDLPPGYCGDFHEDVKAHVAGRIHLADLFTKKLAHLPLDFANPVWVEDGEVDLDYHVQRVMLPRPGTMAQLEAVAARLHSHLLDRSRPLWEFHVIEGLKSGQVALYIKVHHAAIDGVGAESVSRAVLDTSPLPRAAATLPERTKAADQPGVSAMIANVLRHTATQYWKIVKYLPTTAKAVGSLMLPSAGKNGKGGKRGGLANRLKPGPRTPLNTTITNQRVFATVRIPLVEAKAVGNAFGGSLNDAVLAVCSGALRRYLDARGALPAEPLKVVMPVNLRAQGNTEQNNQFSMALASLPTDQAGAKERMLEIVASSSSLKSTLSRVKSALPTDLPSLGVPWLMSAFASLYSRTRLADRVPPLANVLISNVPGVQTPLYMAGARMASYYPLSIPLHGIALNITVMSYNGALEFGLIACRRAMPDVRELAKFMSEAHLELMALLQAEQRKAPRRKAARRTVKAHAAAEEPARASVTPLPLKTPVKTARRARRAAADAA
ncbi:wax ester/triacylglycerol synthase family O-acyltransferase [Noviherbaspirillum sp. UKPF54]|uniref:WS/DGAT/MGAT family O-acyltransferase n=1 Tax=Noviherbaspirillum sp. UKPF54 TaxID=2601898 RepID=UPI0011B1BDFE|nr:wax ester/triacylglycerol synthase family O-acyltransferase [Noviherbaspirillum sp. UKPF54]QDZ26811.1 wax ester/triacylglycerol synthase family O-acyltransferase [Noviherbaspirillum sp. UKPF54]